MNETKRAIRRTSEFKRDYKKAKKQCKDISQLLKVIEMLANDEPLPESHRDHALIGNWVGHRECHVTPDWLLVYKKTGDEVLEVLVLLLVRIASHSNLDL